MNKEQTMSRYQQGKIYKIVNDVDGDIYIGSTCQPRLCRRFAIHKNAYLNFVKGQHSPMKLYQHMLAIGFDHFSIELIETYPCRSKDELHAREGHLIRQLKPALNKNIPGRTRSQYVQDNREKIYQQNRESNMRYIEERKKHDKERTHVDFWCDCGAHITSRSHSYTHIKTQAHQMYQMFGGLNRIEI